MSGTTPQIPVFIVLTQVGCDLARRLAGAFDGAEVHGLAHRAEGADQAFEQVAPHLKDLFRAGRPIVGLCAAGILIRALAPLLDDKQAEPPVIALAEDGSAVVPLLGGHRGANELAEAIAGKLDIAAAVTTAGDRRFGLALDAPPEGWRLGNSQHYKEFVSNLLSVSEVRLVGDADWLREGTLPLSETGDLTIRVTHEACAGSPRELVYHPACLAVGVGCERGCMPEELATLVRATLAEHGLAAGAVAALVSIDLKADEPAVHAAALDLNVPARFFDVAALAAEEPRLATPSDLVRREVGVAGVAEGAALAAAGPEGALIVPKAKSRRATCAIALAPGPIGPAAIGRPRGRLAVVGLGPGDADWRTPEVARELRHATDWVGYRLYLDLLGPLADGKAAHATHAYELGEEEARVRHALDLAAEGRRVALVCSGDPGIYAMASLLFELLEREGRADWNRIEIAVAPGLSALQAAAARIGAPLGHDFCAISLSDLMTPWPVIERRLEAAGAGDFVVALYNPVSGRRRHQLTRAAEILGAHRPADTPVVLARNLGRPGEAVTVIDLAALTPDRVDMLTLVLVGSSETRRVTTGQGLWVYTPRGYGTREDKAQEASGCLGMTVHFIGAGPGAPDLLTLRGRDLIAAAPVVLYAGSLVPEAVIAHAPEDALVMDTASMTLDEIVAVMKDAHDEGKDVARVHSGDPSLYGAIGEQIRRLEAFGIAYDITPGVPAYAAAAAVLGCELTLPEVSQTVILTRTAMKASAMPAGEELEALGASGATLAIHLSVRNLRQVVEALTPHYGADCPVAVVYRVSWPDQQVIRATLADLREKVRAAKITRTALILVGRVLARHDFSDSRLYDPEHVHLLRPKRRLG